MKITNVTITVETIDALPLLFHVRYQNLNPRHPRKKKQTSPIVKLNCFARKRENVFKDMAGNAFELNDHSQILLSNQNASPFT